MNHYSAGIVAIPLQAQNGFAMCPNLFVIDSMLGKVTLGMNPVTEEPIETDCTLVTYRIIYREVLPEDLSLGKPTEVEDIVLRSGTLQMPVDFVPLLFSLNRVVLNQAPINLAFSKFSFRGILTGYNLVIDSEKLQEIVNAQ